MPEDENAGLPAAEEDKRRPGRPKGLGKVPGSGRKPGAPNRKVPPRMASDLRQLILERGRPIELLCDVARGVKIRIGPQAGPGEATYYYPTFVDRIAAARDLMKYSVPVLQGIQLTGEDGGAVKLETEDVSSRDVARAVAGILREAEIEGETDAPLPDVIDTKQFRNGEPVIDGTPEGVAGRSGGLPAAADPRGYDPKILDAMKDPWRCRPIGDTGDPVPTTSLMYLPVPVNGAPHPLGDSAPHWRSANVIDVRPDEQPPSGMVGPGVSAMRAGERILIGEQGHCIEFIQMGNDGRTQWWVLDKNCMRVATRWDESAARAAVDELIRTGKLTKK